jgi:chromate transport protein ChrA
LLQKDSFSNNKIHLSSSFTIQKMHALSIPTWIIHVSSVIEWIAAIWLIWIYGEVSQNPAWRALSFGMLPALVSAMCACTWHYFDNSSALEWLVTLQAAMTLVGNFTLCAAGWWIWRSARSTLEN